MKGRAPAEGKARGLKNTVKNNLNLKEFHLIFYKESNQRRSKTFQVWLNNFQATRGC